MQQKVRKIDRWKGLQVRWMNLPHGLLHLGRPLVCRLKGMGKEANSEPCCGQGFDLVGEAITIRALSGSFVESSPPTDLRYRGTGSRRVR